MQKRFDVMIHLARYLQSNLHPWWRRSVGLYQESPQRNISLPEDSSLQPWVSIWTFKYIEVYRGSDISDIGDWKAFTQQTHSTQP